jgi:hypothetical protein
MTPLMTERRVARIEDCSEFIGLVLFESASDMGPPLKRTDETGISHASGYLRERLGSPTPPIYALIK